MIRGFPNGATRPWLYGVIPAGKAGRRTRGTETSKYPEEKKERVDSLSSGERKGNSLNLRHVEGRSRCGAGVEGH